MMVSTNQRNFEGFDFVRKMRWEQINAISKASISYEKWGEKKSTQFRRLRSRTKNEVRKNQRNFERFDFVRTLRWAKSSKTSKASISCEKYGEHKSSQFRRFRFRMKTIIGRRGVPITQPTKPGSAPGTCYHCAILAPKHCQNLNQWIYFWYGSFKSIYVMKIISYRIFCPLLILQFIV